MQAADSFKLYHKTESVHKESVSWRTGGISSNQFTASSLKMISQCIDLFFYVNISLEAKLSPSGFIHFAEWNSLMIKGHTWVLSDEGLLICVHVSGMVYM